MQAIRLGLAACLVAGVAAGCDATSVQNLRSTSTQTTRPTTPETVPKSTTAATVLATATPIVTHPSVVPWRDEPVTTTSTPTTSTTAPAGPCRASDLVATGEQAGGAGGHTATRVQVTNRGSVPCVLDGYPNVAGVSDDGAVHPFEAGHGTYFGDPGLPAAIDPGEASELTIETSWACPANNGGAGMPWSMLELGLPAGGTIRVRVELDSVCGVSISRFGLLSRQPEPPPTPLPLNATIAAPASVRPGDELIYTVTVTNPTGTVYRFDPCPSYEQYLTTFTGSTQDAAHPTISTYRLNCTAAPSIAPLSSVAFEIHLRVPTDQPPGDAKFGWYLAADRGPYAAAPMTVIP